MMRKGIYFDGVNAYGELPCKLTDIVEDWSEATIYARWTLLGAYRRDPIVVHNWYDFWRVVVDVKVKDTVYLAMKDADTGTITWYWGSKDANVANKDSYCIARYRLGDKVVIEVNGKIREHECNITAITEPRLNGHIGGAVDGPKFKFHGIIHEVAIWNKFLDVTGKISVAEIDEKPVVWLPFVENMGVIAKDYSGNNNHARLYNCKWVSRARRGMYFDNGGIKFDSGLNIDCNYCSVVAVFAIETLNKGGILATGRNCIVRPENEMLMLFNDPDDKKLRFTNYDGTWKEIESNIDLEAGQVYTGVGIMNGNEEHIYLASNGVIIDHNYRDDLGDCGEYTDTAILVGSRNDGKYALHGEVLAVMIYDRPISESEIKQISDFGWFDPPRDGLISWILFDGLKEGDEVKDLITGAIGEPIGTPKFVIRKPKRVLAR